MTEPKFPKYLKALERNRQRAAGGGNTGDRQGNEHAALAAKESTEAEPEAILEPCCEGKVHIVYRGLSDERLYMSRDRLFAEIKFYRPNGLKIFCATCRRRMV